MTLEPITNPWFLSFQVTRLLSSDGSHSLVLPLNVLLLGDGCEGSGTAAQVTDAPSVVVPVLLFL